MKPNKTRKTDDRILMVVTAAIYGHCLRALLDSGTTRRFVSSDVVLPLGLYIFGIWRWTKDPLQSLNT